MYFDTTTRCVSLDLSTLNKYASLTLQKFGWDIPVRFMRDRHRPSTVDTTVNKLQQCHVYNPNTVNCTQHKSNYTSRHDLFVYVFVVTNNLPGIFLVFGMTNKRSHQVTNEHRSTHKGQAHFRWPKIRPLGN